MPCLGGNGTKSGKQNNLYLSQNSICTSIHSFFFKTIETFLSWVRILGVFSRGDEELNWRLCPAHRQSDNKEIVRNLLFKEL